MNDIEKAIETDIDAAIEEKNLDICFRCQHGIEHHDDGDRCRFETCQCKCFE